MDGDDQKADDHNNGEDYDDHGDLCGTCNGNAYGEGSKSRCG
jgi:hypothetical protein